jgi:acetyl-CoA carboxylase carboxyl transferase subunit alpha
MEYLDFELPIKELQEQLEKCQVIGQESDVDVTETCKKIEKKLIETKKSIYKNLSPWQRVQLSRHPNRPYTLDHVRAIFGDTFLELHGDRNVKDDKAMIGGLGKIGSQSYMVIGQQKGYNTKTRQYRNFGMSNPEGYRKALRLMKSAEKFNIPVLTLIDTPGAYPGLEAEERGQGEAIARNILEMTRLKVPIICIIIGEGASGGALGIGVGDRVLMLENTWYSVISPESSFNMLKDSKKSSIIECSGLHACARHISLMHRTETTLDDPPTLIFQFKNLRCEEKKNRTSLVEIQSTATLHGVYDYRKA